MMSSLPLASARLSKLWILHCLKKNAPPLYFDNNSAKKSTDYNNFWHTASLHVTVQPNTCTSSSTSSTQALSTPSSATTTILHSRHLLNAFLLVALLIPFRTTNPSNICGHIFNARSIVNKLNDLHYFLYNTGTDQWYVFYYWNLAAWWHFVWRARS